MSILEVIEFETGQIVTEETRLEDLNVDSLEFLSLILAISDKTGKSIPDEKMADVQTVGDLVRDFA